MKKHFFAIGIICCIALNVYGNDKTPDFFPSTIEKIRNFPEETFKSFSESLEVYNKIHVKSTFENTIEQLDALGKDFISKMKLLKCMDYYIKDESLQKEGAKAFDQLYANMAKLPLGETIKRLITYASIAVKSKDLDPFEAAQLDFILKSVPLEHFPLFAKRYLEKITGSLEKVPQQIYRTLKGSPQTKKKTETLKVFNWNVCFNCNFEPLLFGGIRPWKDRLENVVQTIVEADADIVCLQEVFDPQGANALYEKLKEHYEYFAIQIASRPFCFDPDKLGESSGLFVASKYPLQNQEFIFFKEDNPRINRGFFFFQVYAGSELLASIAATHLEPFGTSEAAKLRAKEMRQIKDFFIDKSDLLHQKPAILCGDLNIPWGSGEEAEKILKESFYDAHNASRKAVDFSNRTYVDFTSYWWGEGGKEGFKPEVLDYFLVFNKEKKVPQIVKAKTVETNNLKNIEKAISDHFGLLTEIKVVY